MPQLMPLLWMMSVFMVSLILMIVVEMFFIKLANILIKKLCYSMVNYKNYLW